MPVLTEQKKGTQKGSEVSKCHTHTHTPRHRATEEIKGRVEEDPKGATRRTSSCFELYKVRKTSISK